MRLITLWHLSFLMVGTCVHSSFSQQQMVSGLFDFLYEDEPIEVTIAVHLDSILEGRRTNDYQDGTFSFSRANQSFDLEVKVRVRGRFRRTRCDFPPLKLNFAKEELEAHGWSDYDKMKLVTHCDEVTYKGNTNLLKEFLVYKMYNQVTDYSYRVQLLKVTYLNLDSGKSITRYAFLLEPTRQLEDRIKAKECDDCHNLEADSFDLVGENRLAMFQYLIGNEDWSTQSLRNVKIMQPNSGSGVHIIPYDFDFSGLVATEYAIARRELGLKSIKDRYFLGYAVHREVINQNIVHFQSRKQDLLALVDGFEELPKRTRKEVAYYIQDFFDCLHTLHGVVAEQGRNMAYR